MTDAHQDLTTAPANPMRLVLFRRLEHCCITALNPLFGIITLDNVVLDVLHTLDLGVAQYFAGAVFAFVILSGLYGNMEYSTVGVRVAKGVLGLKRELMKWYKDNRTTNKSRVSNFTPHMAVGDVKMARPCVHAKGAESRGLAEFAVHLLETKKDHPCFQDPQAVMLLNAGRALLECYKLLTTDNTILTDGQGKSAVAAVVNHCTLYRHAGFELAPKHHLWLHMAFDMQIHGNATFYSTYADESFNKTLKGMARLVHPTTFGISCIKKFFVHLRHVVRAC